jgi:hypothetical protein
MTFMLWLVMDSLFVARYFPFLDLHFVLQHKIPKYVLLARKNNVVNCSLNPGPVYL